MLTRYLRAALHQALYKVLEDGSFFGEIPGFDGVWANGGALESCREELEEVLEEWVLFRVSRQLPLPKVDNIELKIREVALTPALRAVSRRGLVRRLRLWGSTVHSQAPSTSSWSATVGPSASRTPTDPMSASHFCANCYGRPASTRASGRSTSSVEPRPDGRVVSCAGPDTCCPCLRSAMGRPGRTGVRGRASAAGSEDWGALDGFATNRGDRHARYLL